MLKVNILNKTTTRRGFLKTAAAIPGGAVLATGPSWAFAADEQSQIDYLSAILEKYTLTAKSVNRDDIEQFVRRFTAQHGVVRYRAEFAGVPGEARLIKLFVQNRHPGVISFEAAQAAKV